MASKKQFISIVAASILAASFTMTGCGSSSSSNKDDNTSSSSSDSSSSSSMPGAMSVTVSDAYVVGATVTAGGVEATMEAAHGVYEWNVTVEGALEAVGGVNDMDFDGYPTNGEPYAPTLSAPAGWTNVNPFTSMLECGEFGCDNDAAIAAMYPAAGAVETASGLPFDFDVVTAGTESLDVAKETAIAALTLSSEQNGGEVPSSSSSSEDSSSSDSSSSASSDDSVTPPAPAAGRVVPPAPGEDTTSSSESSSSDASSSEAADMNLEAAIAAINACADQPCIDAVVVEYMGAYNGVYGASSSSSSDDNSSSSSSDSSSSASSDDSVTPPAP